MKPGASTSHALRAMPPDKACRVPRVPEALVAYGRFLTVRSAWSSILHTPMEPASLPGVLFRARDSVEQALHSAATLRSRAAPGTPMQPHHRPRYASRAAQRDVIGDGRGVRRTPHGTETTFDRHGVRKRHHTGMAHTGTACTGRAKPSRHVILPPFLLPPFLLPLFPSAAVSFSRRFFCRCFLLPLFLLPLFLLPLFLLPLFLLPLFSVFRGVLSF